MHATLEDRFKLLLIVVVVVVVEDLKCVICCSFNVFEPELKQQKQMQIVEDVDEEMLPHVDVEDVVLLQEISDSEDLVSKAEREKNQ